MKKLAMAAVSGCIALMPSAYGEQRSDRTDALAAELVVAWSKSLIEFTNVAHTACCKVFSISDPTNRLQKARAYIESILSLPKQRYDCDFAGLTARMIACRYMTERLPDNMPLSLEFKWEIIARWWLQMKDELVHFEAFGPRLPTKMYSGILFSEEAQRKAVEKVEAENEKRTQYDREREHARKIRGFMNGYYGFSYERQLNADCATLDNPRKDALLQMVIEATDRVPKWYQDDLAGRGLTFNLNTMSRTTLDPDSTVSAYGEAIKINRTQKDDIGVDVDL